jgi:hypothetical protein
MKKRDTPSSPVMILLRIENLFDLIANVPTFTMWKLKSAIYQLLANDTGDTSDNRRTPDGNQNPRVPRNGDKETFTWILEEETTSTGLCLFFADDTTASTVFDTEGAGNCAL